MYLLSLAICLYHEKEKTLRNQETNIEDFERARRNVLERVGY